MRPSGICEGVRKGCNPDWVPYPHKGLRRRCGAQIGARFGSDERADGCGGGAHVRTALCRLEAASASPHRSIVLQEQAPAGVEIIVGVRNHPGFGSLLVVGPGGVFVDLYSDKSVRLGPVHEQAARETLDETAAGKLLRGFRGDGPYDLDAAAKAIAAFSTFGAATLDTVAAVEINPLIVSKSAAFAVDLVIELHGT
jgi:acetate---CoA ligase (ADP-forming)